MAYHAHVRRVLLPMVVSAVVGVGCGFDWDALDPRATTASSSSASAGGGGTAGGAAVGGAGGNGGSPVTSGGGAAGGGAGGGSALSDEGVLARFFLDEAGRGQTPADVADVVAGLTLPITYDGTSPVFIASPTGRGLRWNSQTTTAKVSGPVGSGALRSGLDGAQQLTIELVVEVEDTPIEQARMLQVSTVNSASGDVGVQLEPGSGRVAVDFNDDVSGADVNAVWERSLLGVGRAVLHVVLDTTEAEVEDRAVLYVNDARVAAGAPGPVPLNPIAAGDALSISSAHVLTIGCREAATPRPFPGTISYVAIYQGVMGDAVRENNVEVLVGTDDP